MSGCLDGYLYGWLYGCMNGCSDGCMSVFVAWWIDDCLCGDLLADWVGVSGCFGGWMIQVVLEWKKA